MAKKKKGLDPTIRKMVCANHGGFDDANDAAILSVWNSLGPEIQKRYAEKQKSEVRDQKGTKDADSD